MRRTVAITLVVALATLIAAGVLAIRVRRDGALARSKAQGTAHAPSARAVDSDVRVPTWLGQPGAPARRVAGHVTYRDTPVAGARVRLLFIGIDDSLVPPIERRADEHGAFDFGPQIAANIVVSADAPNYAPTSVDVNLADPSPETAPDALVIELSGCDVNVSGTVRDVSGGVVPGAHVTARYRSGLTEVAADDRAHFAFCLPRGDAWLAVHADGYGGNGVGVSAYVDIQRDLVLAPETVVEGKVVRADTGDPIEGALVEAERAGLEVSYEGRAQALSNHEGHFRIVGLAPGRYGVSAHADDLGSRHPVDVVTTVGRATEGLVCRLVPLGRVRGLVVEDGKPVAGIDVHFLNPDWRDQSSSQDAMTQADGSFMLAGLAPARYSVAVYEHELFDPKAVDVRAGQTEVTIRVAPMAKILGRVLRAGSPVQGAFVFARDASIRSERGAISRVDGTFEIDGLAAGTYRISADTHDRDATATGITVTLAKAELRRDVVVDIDLASTIAGIVVDEHGTPVAGAYLKLQIVHGDDGGVAMSEADGTFFVKGLSGGGDYAVEVSESAGSPLGFSPAKGEHFPSISVKDGETHIEGVRIAVRADRRAITGRVLRAGAPAPDVQVAAQIPNDQSGEFLDYGDVQAKTTTGIDGTFRLDNLVPGAYVIRASTGAGARALQKDVAAGTDGIVLTLPEVNEIHGSLVGFGETPTVDITSLGIDYSTYFSAQVTGTEFHVRDLPVGRYYVHASAPGEGDGATVTVTAGAPAEVTLRSHGKGTVRGQVVDLRTGAPVGGVQCSWSILEDGPSGSSSRASSSVRVTSDPRGIFTMEAPAGEKLKISCSSDDYPRQVIGTTATALVVGGTADVRLLSVSMRHDGVIPDAGISVGGDPGGAHIGWMSPDGAAARAGLQLGDLVVTVGDTDTTVLTGSQVNLLIVDRAPGETAQLGIVRAGQRRSVGVVVQLAKDQ